MRILTRISLIFALLLCTLGCEEDNNWSLQELGTDAQFQDVFFLNSETGWIVGGGYPVEGGIIGSTVDGGQTWSFTSDLIHGRRNPHAVHLQAVQFLDERRGFIVADSGTILRTVDGGEHWHTVHRGSRHLRDLQFVDNLHGWAVGGSTLLRTTDGGTTWEPPIPWDTEQPFSGQAIRFIDRETGWAVGKAGAIYRTTDGGVSWTELARPESGQPEFRALSFLDTDRGWIVGERGTVLHTMDGGRTWAPQLRVEGEALFALAFTKTGDGWAVGERIRPHAQRLLHYVPSEAL